MMQMGKLGKLIKPKSLAKDPYAKDAVMVCLNM